MAANGLFDEEMAEELGRSKGSIQGKRYNEGIKLFLIDEDVFGDWTYKNSWVLGFMTADGSYSESKPKEFVVYNTDLELIKNFRDVFKTRKKIYDIKNETRIGNKPVYRLQIWNEKIINFLKSINACGNKDERNPFPIIPDQYKWSFIKGLFDGDGNIYKGTFSIAGRKELIKFVYYWMCHQINKFPNKIYTHSATDITKYFQFCPSDSNKIFELIEENSNETYDSQKYLRWKKFYDNSA